MKTTTQKTILVKHETLVLNTEWHLVSEEDAKKIEKEGLTINDVESKYLTEFEDGYDILGTSVAENQELGENL